MDFKKFGLALVFFGGVLVAFGALYGHQEDTTADITETHVLTGTTAPAGGYVYAEDMPYYTVTVLYPATTTLAGKADSAARLAIETALAQRIDEFKTNGNFASLTPEDISVQGLGPDRKYALDMMYKVYASAKYVSYVYTIYEDTLGAHPNAYYLTLVFDATGSRVGITDILAGNPNGLEELSLVASAQVNGELKKRIGVDDTTGSIFADGLSPTEHNYRNFYVDGDTLAVLFQPYQVAAYALGSFEARIPLADLK